MLELLLLLDLKLIGLCLGVGDVRDTHGHCLCELATDRADECAKDYLEIFWRVDDGVISGAFAGTSRDTAAAWRDSLWRQCSCREVNRMARSGSFV